MRLSPSRKKTVLSAFLFLLVSFWLGLAGQVQALTTDEEKELGREFYSYVKKQVNIVDDPAIQGYVESLGRKILKVVGPQPFEYRFFVIQNEVMNAFAGPAGYIFIHSGLIENFQSEGELAAIISHEIAHVTSRHLSERMAKSQKMSLATLGGMIAGVFLGGPAGQALMMGSIAGNVQMQLAYSREDEREADRKGLDYLVQSGYDPKYMIQSFQALLQANWHQPSDIPTYLTTHPGLSERISSVERNVQLHPGYGQVLGRGDEKAFKSVKVRTMAQLADPQRARNGFEEMLRQNPGDPLAHYGLALLYKKNQDFDRSVAEFQKALENDPANPSILSDLGAVLFQQKDFQGAMNVLGKAVILRPDWVQALSLLARIYEEQGQAEQARDLYKRVLAQEPDNPEALYGLGMIYGQEGKMALAHLHTGRYFNTQEKPDKAMFHLGKAREAATGADAGLLPEIEEAVKEAKQQGAIKKREQLEEQRKKLHR